MRFIVAIISTKKPILTILCKRLLLLSLLLTNTSMSYAATLTSTVTRNKIGINETLQLNVNIDQQVDSSTLQLKALQTNFDILSITPHSSNSMSIINGKTTQNAATQWTLLLAPKHVGVVTIPAFTINNTSSQAITITITDEKSSNHATDKPLTVLVTTSSNAIYPEQQLILTIEISAHSNVRNLNGSQLELENADVELLSQQNFQRVKNGIARQFVELKYVVFAKKPGHIRIPPLVFTGLKNARRSFFNTHGDQVIGRSVEQSITVKKKPDSTTAWFPAEAVSLRAEWSGNKSTLQAGTPITRNIIVTAQGQRANVIPPISGIRTNQTHYKIYKDQAQLDTKKSADGLIATRIESEAIVPSSAGNITLPEITLRWWNVKTQAWQNAVLPAETLTVFVGGADTAAKQQNTAQNKQVKIPPPNKTERNDVRKAVNSSKLGLWQSMTGLLLCLCIIQGFLLLRSRKPAAQKKTPYEKLDDSEKKQWRQLQASLKQADAQRIRQNIINWAQSSLPNEQLITLHSLGEQLDIIDLKTALTELEEHLFKDSKSIDTKKLNHALNTARQQIKLKNNRKIIDKNGLKPLYANQ